MGLLRNPRIAHIEADGRAYAVEETLPWGVDRIDAEVVHAAANKGTGVKIAIIDTGIGPHPDLLVQDGHRYLNSGEISDSNYADDNGHGTHCAGIAAAQDNDFGVIGVAPEASLYAVKVLDSSGSGYYGDIIAGIEWCIANGIQVISMSLGGSTTSTDLENICNSAYYDHGIIVVAAAGNSGNRPGAGDNINYPAKYDSVIAVAATDQNDSRAKWSSTGLAAELSAPGVNIYSTYLNNGYATASGTSMACPHVSGTVALVKAANSSMTNVQVRERLQITADDLGATGWDEKYGYGLVDAEEAASGQTTPTNNPPVANTDGPYTGTVGTPVSFDGSGSSDPDSDPLTYAWNFGDGETGTGISLNHTYAATGEYTVTLVVNDGTVDSVPATTTATISQVTTTGDMHIANITMSISTRTAGKNTFYTGIAEVTVVDAGGASVEGVSVSGNWSGLTQDSDSGITDASGVVKLTSDSVKNATGTFTFTVDNLVKNGWDYISGSNVETSDSVTIP